MSDQNDLRAELEAAHNELALQSALERVRSRAQSMRRSDELGEVASLVFHEFKQLGIELWRSGFWVFDTETDTGEVWLTSTSGEIQPGDQFRLSEMDEHPAVHGIAQAFRRGDSFYYIHFYGDDMWSFLRFAIERFRELSAAEAQAREAERHSAVDRIRAEIAAMHTSDDFPGITPLLWQLTRPRYPNR